MKKFQISFLINPVSGDGLGLKVYSQLPEIMRSFGYEKTDWDAQLTEKDNLATQTQEVLRQSHKVIAVGGDGTMGFVLNQLGQEDFSQTQIGLIPMGTGNDLGRTLGIYKIYKERGLLACIKRLIKAQAIDFNLWSINDTFTLSAYISLGMDAAILHDVDKARKRVGFKHNAFVNKLLFLKYFKRRLKYRLKSPSAVTFWLAGQVKTLELVGQCSCIIANINSYGGGSSPSRSIKFNDDKLDILIFGTALKFFIFMTLARIFPTPPFWLRPLAQIYQADSLTIQSSSDEFLQVDGEFFRSSPGTTQINIKPGHRVAMLDLRASSFSLF